MGKIRYSIEEEFWAAVAPFAKAIGDETLAIGMAVKFLEYAQIKQKNGLLITEEEFKEEGFSELLIPFFARRKDAVIQAIDAEKYVILGGVVDGKA